MSERITITATADEVAALQERAGRLTRAENARRGLSDFVRNAVAFYCAEQDKCLSCQAGVTCAIHGTDKVRPPAPAAAAISADDMRHVTAIYISRFIATRGIRPQFGAAEGRAVKSLILRMGVEQSVDVIARAFTDPFWRDKATILSIAADPSRHMGNGAKPQARTSLQADSGYQGGEEKQ